MHTPLRELFDLQDTVILDGGLATTLEDHGYNLDDPLWSARLLIEDPGAIARVHRDFLAAGADVITTATYQASLPGLAARGLGPERAKALLISSVDLALRARDEFLGDPATSPDRQRPLIAASVGPYGAFLADGSEYDGRYGLETADLGDFHRERVHILAESGADLLAFETLPSLPEVAALVELLDETDCEAWFAFCCRDGGHLWDGTPVGEAARVCARSSRVAAVGVNCTAPRHVDSLLRDIREAVDLPLTAYPNAGETYDPASRSWRTTSEAGLPLEAAGDWVTLGVRLAGGCCRVGPAAIARLREALLT